jgi:hypothetical protein
MFAPRDQTVKMAVGAQIGFLHTGVGSGERTNEGRVWARREDLLFSDGIASGELNAGKRSGTVVSKEELGIGQETT